MVKQLSPFVKINYFDQETVKKSLRNYVQTLYKKHSSIEKVIVFGSFIRGESVPGSDIDLLIILKKSKTPFSKRISQYMPSNFPIGMDVFPYTKREIEKMLNEGNLFLKRALEEGKEIKLGFLQVFLIPDWLT